MQKMSEATTMPKKVFKKVTADIIKMEVGQTVEGKYIGKSTGPWMDRQTGEEKELTRLFFLKDDDTKFILFEDGGLRNAMANAMVKEGDYIQVEKKEPVSIGSGRKSNQYDIYIAQ